MPALLNSGDIVRSAASETAYEIGEFLGEGSQGEVYAAHSLGKRYAIKWFKAAWLTMDTDLRARLEHAVSNAVLGDRFVWPLDIVISPRSPGFGCVLPLVDPRLSTVSDLICDRADPTFRALSNAGLEIATAFGDLHRYGDCFSDVSINDIHFDLGSGAIRITGRENIATIGSAMCVGGTPRFMAPEIIRGEAGPDRRTDLFSLAVVLFHIFMIHHPLDGQQEALARTMDMAAMKQLYATDPIFVFDREDTRNGPVPGIHDHVVTYWNLYPEFLREIFRKAFSREALHDPDRRVGISEWRAALLRLRDAVVTCRGCGIQNFFDLEDTAADRACWRCGNEIVIAPTYA